MSFSEEIKNFQEQIMKWQKEYPQWADQIVFNEDLLRLSPPEVRFILVGDNPGREEQKSHRYLVGTAGKGARRFFEETSGLVSSFEKEVMVLNKTPVFTPSTMDLGDLSEINSLLEESQRYMASFMIRMQKLLGCPLWITGFGGCRNAKGDWNVKPAKTRPLGIFFQSLREEAVKAGSRQDDIQFFKHFSYAHFQKDAHLENIPKDREEYLQRLNRIGSGYSKNFFNNEKAL